MPITIGWLIVSNLPRQLSVNIVGFPLFLNPQPLKGSKDKHQRNKWMFIKELDVEECDAREAE